ncbi:amino acid adenylation domain-containing protein [Tumebacillus sp. ITR2]|uniref:Amino acid adenylation domain-containing protein n=1 Tax=Tumebacillus amylolyticus TaxID=2801339 RepID=A0ABS1JEF1_9BACL|nr:non-ribosomal peptide synthetase [Tumebacillus amylolyticus]MBL0388673.1 amino acid adenylation domain-containing protein [Tumebacillus amylolyticus]
MNDKHPYIQFDIRPSKHFEHNCIDDVIASLTEWLERRYELMYFGSWNFGFASEGTGSLGERLHVKPSRYREFLERYHGMKSTVLTSGTSEDALRMIVRELRADRPVVLTMNSYWVPWDENYQQNDVVHSLIITGHNPETDDLYATDPYFKMQGALLPVQEFHRGFQHVTMMEVVADEVIDTGVLTDLQAYLEQTLEEGVPFQQMEVFADALATHFDLQRETEGFAHFTDVPLFSQLGDVADGRVKFALLLDFLGSQFHSGFFALGESMKKAAANWGVIRGSLIKMFLTKKTSQALLDKSAERIRQAAVVESKLAADLLAFLKRLQSGADLDGAMEMTAATTEMRSEFVAPQGDLETKLAAVWQEVLRVERIGVEDPFFELGGQSLQALACATLLHKELGMQVPVRLFFEYPTIRELAEALQAGQGLGFTSLQAVEQREFYPLTSQQKRMYVLHQFSGAATSYNIPSAMVIQGAIDAERLAQSLQRLAVRHESFRTSFHLVDGVPLQKIAEAVEMPLEREDASSWSCESEQEQIERSVASFLRPFDLQVAPLARFALVKLADDRHLFLADLHHIVADGVSLAVLNRECMALYHGEELPDVRVQVKEYAVWQQEQVRSTVLQEQERYWLDTLAGIPPMLDIPLDYVRPSTQTFAGRRLFFTVSEDVTAGLKRIATETGSTLYMVLLALYSMLISAYAREQDVVVGTPISGRTHADTEQVIGMFVNTLVMRNWVDGELVLAEFVKQVKERALQAYENQDYPFEELVEKLHVPRDMGRNPVFDTLFVMQNTESLASVVNGLTCTPCAFDHSVSKFDLSMEATEQSGVLEFCLDYRTDLFAEDSMRGMIEHFQALLRSAADDPLAKIADLALMNEAEQDRLLVPRTSDADVRWEESATLHGLFEEQVRRTSDQVAVVCGDEQVTYRELDEQANRVARVLREKGIGPDGLVAVMMERSVKMIAVLLGVLKAGGAYLPLDPEYPEDRISFTLEDSQVRWLVIDQVLMDRMKFSGDVLGADDLLAEHTGSSFEHGTAEVRAENLAYVIYTSGTTGRPKGVMIEHRQVVQLMTHEPKKFSFSERDVWTMFHSFCFDFSVWEMYGALLTGGKLVVVPKEVARDPQAFAKLVSHEEVTVLNQTPSAFYALQQAVLDQQQLSLSVRVVIFGGEALKPALLKSWKSRWPQTSFVNMYGITETTVHVTYKEIGDAEMERNLSAIGQPLPTYAAYVFDEQKRLVPTGVPGELYVGGAGVARGYLNRPELTAERFVENPYRPGERLYRSGDLVRLLPTGELEYRGRIDHQVKIRGYRIETGEIEHRLQQLDFVEEAVVLAVADVQGTNELCAYVVTSQDVEVQQLRGHLAQDLPAYMIPAHFVRLERMPLTSNGKVDRRALPKPDESQRIGTVYVAPVDALEMELAALWQDVLRVERVGAEDDFFALGGHSLNATTLVARIAKQLGREVPLAQFFATPTLRGLADVLRRSSKADAVRIAPVAQTDVYPVTSAQKRLLLLQELDGVDTSYNMPAAFLLEGQVDRERLTRAFQQLTARHESLRTEFDWHGKEPVQRVCEDIPFELLQIEGGLEGWVSPFDLTCAPLWRAGLWTQEESRHVLVLDMHHIISDGVSMTLLIQDLIALYAGETLPELELQYKDYAVKEQELHNREAMRVHESYWLQKFQGGAPILQMPFDRPRPAVKSFAGSLVSFRAEAALSAKLDAFARQTGTTLYMLLVAAFTALLYKHGGQEDIVIGTPVAGRLHADVEPIVGLFVNTLALRNQVNPEASFAKFLHEVKSNTLKALEHQAYPLDQLVNALEVPRDLSRNALFDVMFALQNFAGARIELDGLSIRPYEIEQTTSRMDLTLMAEERDEGLHFVFEYSTALFDRRTIENLAARFLVLLERVTADADVKMKDLDVLTDVEKHNLLAPTVAPVPTLELNGLTIHQVFEDHVRRAPDAPAVSCGSDMLTYAELDRWANRLARKLRRQGVSPDQIVGVLTEPSVEMMVAILGVLKAGGAYVPIDPAHPLDRIAYMLENSGASVLVTQQKVYASLQEQLTFTGDVLRVEDPALAEEDSCAPAPVATSENLAYVIYTSGTTGRPKGVGVEHRNLLEVILRLPAEDFRFGPGDVWTQFHSYGFDFSVWEMFGCLLTGGKLVVVPRDIGRDTPVFLELVRREKVTVLGQTPSAFYSFTSWEDKGSPDLHVHTVIFGGEALKAPLLASWKNRYPNSRLINIYGITETAIVGTYKDVGCYEIEHNVSSIGNPFPAYTCTVLDEHRKLVPPGSVGELYIGGPGVARGYVNNSELTGERFIPHPYNQAERVYKSGDLVRVLHNGEFEYLGRLDHQVKIRGHRIEIGEIEHRLQEHEATLEAVVLAMEDERGLQELCAYLVTEGEVSLTEIRSHLAEQVPGYMIPAHFVLLQKMPLTANGKVDRRALPKPDASTRLGWQYVAPSDEVETQMAALWQEVLSVEVVGAEDDFFAIGGHSLLATVLISRIHKEFGVSIPLRQLFLTPTVRSFAEEIRKNRAGHYNSIGEAAPADCYPLSSAQKRMFLLQELEGAGTAYNIPAMFELEGKLDRDRVEEAFRRLITRHESLRTSFAWRAGEPVQVVEEHVEFSLEHVEASDVEKAAKEWVRPFDLTQAPLLRAGLSHGAERHVLFLDLHHIIADGVSMGVLVRDFAALYAGEELPPLRLQYKDYALWQQEQLDSTEMQKQEAYWLKEFAQGVPVLDLPTDRERPAVKSFAGALWSHKADAELTARLKLLAQKTGSTLYMVLLAAFQALLYKHSGHEDIVIGSPVAGRTHADLENTLGMFVGTVALRCQPTGGKTFTEFLKEVRETALSAIENQDYPFDLWVSRLDLPRDMSRSALFDVMFVMQNLEDVKLEEVFGELVIRPYETEHTTSKFDLTLTAKEEDDGLTLAWEYATELFDERTVTGFGRRLQMLLEEVTSNPDVRLAELTLLAPDEHKFLLSGLQAEQEPVTETDFDWEFETGALAATSLHQRIEEQARRQPHRVAVVCGDESFTYAELDAKANGIAVALTAHGVTSEAIVGVLMERSLDMIAALLGVLKAGGAYLPLDPDAPRERIEFTLEDSGARWLVTQRGLAQEIEFSGILLSVEDMDPVVNSASIAVQEEQLAYVIYTSGTTGKPKGVQIQHHNVLQLIDQTAKKFSFDAEDVWTMFHSFAFDFSVWEMYGALMHGGKLIIVPKMIAQDAGAFLHLVQEENVTVLNQTPSAFYSLQQAAVERGEFPERVRLVIFGGEALKPILLKPWKQNAPQTRLVNMYGITETTVHVTFKELSGSDLESSVSTIGTPLPLYTCYVLDENRRFLPPGVPGELYVGGSGVARGYLNREHLTEERFVENPYRPQERLYKSGDLVRLLPNGELEYRGRIDHQVKIRGYRIEIGEIEHRLQEHEATLEAVVLAMEDEHGLQELCAYLVTEGEVSLTEIRSHLAEQVPGYMIPAHFVLLQKMPLTANGKVDRRALPKPDASTRLGWQYVAPSDAMETQMAALWQEVLSVEVVGAEDDFFAIGGHSLLATVLISRIHKEFGVSIPLRQLFLTPTVRSFAEEIRKNRAGHYNSIGEAAPADCYPLSSAQKRMFLLQELEGAGTAYNIPAMFELEGKLDRDRVEEAFRRLITRHESLRTSFAWRAGEPVQVVEEHVEFSLEHVEASDVEKAAKEWVRPFDLTQAPLLRAGLSHGAERHVLFLDLHHIIADGVSMGVLVRDFAALYAGEELPPLRLQYKDYAVWQQEQLDSTEMQKQEAYWLKEFAQGAPVLDLPTDRERPAVKSFAGALWSHKADAELTARLKFLAQKTGSTLYMVLLAAFQALLYKHSGHEDIVIGSPVAGRTHADLANTLGMFVGTVALRCQPTGGKTFMEFLQEVRETALSAIENQDYPFDLLVSRLDLPRDMSRSALFDVMFVMQNLEDVKLEEVFGELVIRPYETEHTTSKFDLTLTAKEEDDGLTLAWEYATELFDERTVTGFGRRLQMLLEEVTSNPDVRLAELTLLAPDEQKLLLSGLQAEQEPVTETGETDDFDWEFETGAHSLHRRIEEQARRQPHRVAVVCGDESFTYAELDAKANGIAVALSAHGVTSEAIVGVLMERSLDMIAALLGVLKAGGAYLPLDPDAPRERIEFTLEDSGARWLVTQRGLAQEIEFSGTLFSVEDMVPVVDSASIAVQEEQLAYVIYTSGTTGKPKGVQIQHHNVLQLIDQTAKKFSFDAEDVWTMFHSFAFDFSVWEMYGALMHGGKLIIVPKMIAQDAGAFLNLVQEENVTVLNQTPSAFYSLQQAAVERNEFPERVRLVIFGGEALKPIQLKPWKKNAPQTRLVNMYGITETTVHVTFKELSGSDLESSVSTIGTPLPLYTCYVLDENRRFLPPGVPGELYVGGSGVARGYLNREHLTEERFVVNPYRPQERLYKSGDLVRLLPNGELEYRGRIDHQVKIRGYRIELGEIEHRLLQHDTVQETVVLAMEQELCAYVVTKSEVSLQELRGHLAETLPSYMVPSHFLLLDSLPLTHNGKVDRRALPTPNASVRLLSEYEAPSNDRERQLAEIWQDVLQIERIGVGDDFFASGGHSLKAVRMTARVYERLGLEVSLRDVYQHPTIRHLANHLGRDESPRELLVHLGGAEQAVRTLFAFPPLGGDAYTFKGLAAHLLDSELYGFDFLVTEDRIEQYVRLLREVQPQGPYHLLAYSAGGNLAYEVARTLEAEGLDVAMLLLVDSLPGLEEELKEFNDADLLRFVEQIGGGYWSEWLSQPGLRKRMVEEMNVYLAVCAKMQFETKLHAPIHLIKSTDPVPDRERWAQITQGEFHAYQGVGGHFEMLGASALSHNAERIRQILGDRRTQS